MPILNVEEYVEQSHLFKSIAERLNHNEPIQTLLKSLRVEILATTNLPKAVSFILDELNHAGLISTAMQRLSHYFAPFQTYVVMESENERGRFDSYMAMVILHQEASLRANQVSPQALFFYQFETLCRNRLNYDRGLAAMALDPFFDATWSKWILSIRHKLGIVDLADLVYVHSRHYEETVQRAVERQSSAEPKPETILFGVKEGRIALANRRAEPLHFFAALQRQLGYPAVPQPKRRNEDRDQLLKLQRTVERLEVRIKLLEEEQREKGIDLSRFMKSSPTPPPSYDDSAGD